MIDRRRLVAPKNHLEVLIEPALSDEVVRTRLQQRATSSPHTSEALSTARSAILNEQRYQTPVFVTGHQAEFFHAGVFAKLIAADELARTHNGTALFVIVDTDESKQHSIAVPQVTQAGLRKTHVRIPGTDARIPVCDLQPIPQRDWTALFADIAVELPHYDIASLAGFAEAWCRNRSDDISFVDRWTDALRSYCQSVGLTRLRFVRMTDLCNTAAFADFFAQLATDADTFSQEYNRAIENYRAQNRIKSKNRPIPALKMLEGRIELPFWLSQSGKPRQRLFVQAKDQQLEVFADATLVATASLDNVGCIGNPSQMLDLPDGWRVFPRALALSAFCRLFVGDLFIHGIGGAKYDEITTAFLSRMFSGSFAPVACVTASLHLPLPKHDVAPNDLRAARHQLRDVQFNPQRYVKDVPATLLASREKLIRRSDELRAEQGDANTRRRVYGEIRAVNDDILRLAPRVSAEFEAAVVETQSRLNANEIAEDREYFFAFHTAQSILDLKRRISTELR